MVLARLEQGCCLRGNDGFGRTNLIPQVEVPVARRVKNRKRSFPMNKIIKKVRGASMVEYALLLVAILLLAAGAFKALGPKVGTAATRSGSQL
jgi:Flp pilus assembly pilin Flp